MEADNWKHKTKIKKTKKKPTITTRFLSITWTANVTSANVIKATCEAIFDQSERMHLYSYQTHCTQQQLV